MALKSAVRKAHALEDENDNDSLENSEQEIDIGAEFPLTAAVIGLLFVSPRPLSEKTLAHATGARINDVREALNEVGCIFRENEHGFSLISVAGGWQFRSSPKLSPAVRKIFAPRRRRISRAAAETLAVVAYKQPIQRAEIEAIRGVDALPTLKTLLDQHLIRIVGKQDAPGQPTLYGTTHSFLERFGLRDLTDLPSAKEIERLADEGGEGERGDEEDDFLEDDTDELVEKAHLSES